MTNQAAADALSKMGQRAAYLSEPEVRWRYEALHGCMKLLIALLQDMNIHVMLSIMDGEHPELVIDNSVRLRAKKSYGTSPLLGLPTLISEYTVYGVVAPGNDPQAEDGGEVVLSGPHTTEFDAVCALVQAYIYHRASKLRDADNADTLARELNARGDPG